MCHAERPSCFFVFSKAGNEKECLYYKWRVNKEVKDWAIVSTISSTNKLVLSEYQPLQPLWLIGIYWAA